MALQRLRVLTVPILAFVSALVIGAIFILVTDPKILSAYGNFFHDPGNALSLSWKTVSTAYSALFAGAIGNPADMVNSIKTYLTPDKTHLLLNGFYHFFPVDKTTALLNAFYPLSESLVASTPYIFAGLAVAIGFKCNLFNIGAEGQIYIGALVSAYVGYSIVGLPWYIHMPLTFLAGAIGGAIWGGIPGFLKARTGAHEVINTMMMNYIAFRLADYLLTGPMKRGGARGFDPISPTINSTAYFPQFFSDPLRLHLGFVVAILIALAIWWFLTKTTLGFEIRTTGANARAARYAGINVSRTIILTMALSGALAAMAGANEVMGVNTTLRRVFRPATATIRLR